LQVVLPTATALGDIRYTLQTTGGDLLTSSHTACVTPPEVLDVSPRRGPVDSTNTLQKKHFPKRAAAPYLDC